jgi:hypothetical protein
MNFQKSYKTRKGVVYEKVVYEKGLCYPKDPVHGVNQLCFINGHPKYQPNMLCFLASTQTPFRT